MSTPEERVEIAKRAGRARWANDPTRWTRPVPGVSFVYVLGPETGPMKIGFTSWVPARRQQIQDAHWVTIRLYFHQACPADLARQVEARAHDQLREHRIRGEWFAVSPREAEAAIRLAYSELVAPLDDAVI